MGPAKLKFRVFYENGTFRDIFIHISKDQDEIDGFIMAARFAKETNGYTPLMQVTRLTDE